MSTEIGSPVPQKLISELILDDPDMRDLVEEFVAELPSRVEELQAAGQQLNWEALQTLAHRLKGAGGSYGYPDLSQAAAAMEQQFKAHSAEHFEQWIAQLGEIIAACQRGLNE